MEIQNVKINLSNVSDTKDGTLFVNAVAKKTPYKKDETEAKNKKEIIGYSLFCSARRGDTLKVTLPVQLATKATALGDSIQENDEPIRVRFTNLKLRLYAIQKDDGRSFAGVSATADDFEIVAEPDDIDTIELEV